MGVKPRALEGKASAAMACVNDLRDFIVGKDPMQSEHLYQLMYIGSFYRGGPVLGSAISGIDQALWDIRGKVMNMPVYEMLGGPVDTRGVRGYYHAEAWTLEAARELRDKTRAAGVTALKFQLGAATLERRPSRHKFNRLGAFAGSSTSA